VEADRRAEGDRRVHADEHEQVDEMSPIGGTTTATSVTIWLGRLVRLRTVAMRGAAEATSFTAAQCSRDPLDNRSCSLIE